VFHSRNQHATLEQERPRVEALLQRYPGPFASAMAADFERTVACLRGTRYELKEDDFAFRRLGEQRVEDIRGRARTAWAEAQARIAAERMEPFPTIDPVFGDRASVAGKVVVLPPLTGRDVIIEANRVWNVAGDPRRGHYFVDRQGPAMQRMFDTEFRYKRTVTGRIKDERTIIGRIGPDPLLLVRDNRAVYGLEVVPEGVLSGDQLFIDLTTIDAEGESPFAGEDTLMRVQDIAVPDDASPRTIMEAFYRALKLGSEKVWSSLYANWHATRYDTHPAYNALWSIPIHWFEPEWVRTRSRLQDKLYDVRVVDEGEPYVLLQQDELPGAPLIEEVEVEVEHIGRFGDEYLAFKELGLNRLWYLQRVARGPWRIAWHNGRHSI
jgi:hypothetical protein